MTMAMVGSLAIVEACSDDSHPPAKSSPTGNPPPPGNPAPNPPPPPPGDSGGDGNVSFTAHATITPTADASATGTVTFTEENGEVTVVVNITNAFPDGGPGGPGPHGLHIHQNGSCAPNDGGPDGAIVQAGAAGGHWNPLDAGHGYPDAAVHHAGDMGNIIIDDAGKGTLTMTSKEWTVQDGGKSVVGHAIVFHVQKDDGVSQPVGDAGARPGCGIITSP